MGNLTCNRCDKRNLVINEYDDFVNVCSLSANKRINCNIFEDIPDWCPKTDVTYTDNGDGTFTEHTEEE